MRFVRAVIGNGTALLRADGDGGIEKTRELKQKKKEPRAPTLGSFGVNG